MNLGISNILLVSLTMVWYGMVWCGVVWYGMVWYSSIYIAPLNSCGPTEALLVRLAPRKEASFKER